MVIHYITQTSFFNYKELIPTGTILSFRYFHHKTTPTTYWTSDDIISKFSDKEVKELLNKKILKSNINIDGISAEKLSFLKEKTDYDIPFALDPHSHSFIKNGDNITRIAEIDLEANLYKDTLGNIWSLSEADIISAGKALTLLLNKGFRPLAKFSYNNQIYQISWIDPITLDIITQSDRFTIEQLGDLIQQGVLLDKTWFTPPFRKGKKNSLVILDATGMEVQQFRNQAVCDICLTQLNQL